MVPAPVSVFQLIGLTTVGECHQLMSQTDCKDRDMAEFDYAGTQACRSLKEEGIEVVLLNSNPATIMTDKDIADRVYIEPLTIEVVEQLIKKEKPDSVLPTLGGQAGLNLAMELEEAGFLKENNVRLIGTTSETIKKAEDRLE